MLPVGRGNAATPAARAHGNQPMGCGHMVDGLKATHQNPGGEQTGGHTDMSWPLARTESMNPNGPVPNQRRNVAAVPLPTPRLRPRRTTQRIRQPDLLAQIPSRIESAANRNGQAEASP